MIHTYIKVYLLKNIVGLLVLTMFFSCEEAAKKSADSQEKIPNGETYNFRLIYTDSTKVRTVLESALNKDFSTQKFPYTEFPKGLVLKLYDEQAHENIIKARYGNCVIVWRLSPMTARCSRPQSSSGKPIPTGYSPSNLLSI